MGAGNVMGKAKIKKVKKGGRTRRKEEGKKDRKVDPSQKNAEHLNLVHLVQMFS